MIVISVFFFSCSADHRDLHSFPTRRSSDLIQVYVRRDDICAGEDKTLYNTVFKKLLDIGDIIGDRKSTRLNSSHSQISYAVFCLKKKKTKKIKLFYSNLTANKATYFTYILN